MREGFVGGILAVTAVCAVAAASCASLSVSQYWTCLFVLRGVGVDAVAVAGDCVCRGVRGVFFRRYFKLDPAAGVLRRYATYPATFAGDASAKKVKSKDLPLRDVTAVTEDVTQPPGVDKTAPVRFMLALRNGGDRILEAHSAEDARVW